MAISIKKYPLLCAIYYSDLASRLSHSQRSMRPIFSTALYHPSTQGLKPQTPYGQCPLGIGITLRKAEDKSLTNMS